MQSVPVIRFGVFEVDLRSGELRKNGLRIKLQDQPFQVLAMLLEEPGQVVTREQLHQKLWPDGTFVDFEHGLHAAIQRLRQALNDSADTPRFIETLPKRGYRFLAPVKALTNSVVADRNIQIQTELRVDGQHRKPIRFAWFKHIRVRKDGDMQHRQSDTPRASTIWEVATPAKLAPGQGPRWQRWTLVVGAAALTVILLAGMGGFIWLRTRSKFTPATPQLLRVTFDTGLTTNPVISSDGKLVVYASDRAGNGDLDLWLQQVAEGDAVRLTNDPADDSEPTFSPNGTKIAFRSERDGGGIYVLSTLGGEPRRIVGGRVHWPEFSPDGASIAYVSRSGYMDWTISVVPSTGGEARVIAVTSGRVTRALWSPDGEYLLYSGAPPPYDYSKRDWWIVSVNGGKPRHTGAYAVFSAGPVVPAVPRLWVRDRIYFTAGQGDTKNLWQVPISSDTHEVRDRPTRVTTGTNIDQDPSISSDGTLVFATIQSAPDLWLLPIQANRGKVTGAVQRLTRDNAREFPSLSRDGTRLLYSTDRGGRGDDIWLRDLPTGRETAVATDPTTLELFPSFSPDGTKAAYLDIAKDNRFSISVLTLATGASKKVCDRCPFYVPPVPEWAPASEHQMVPQWAPDGSGILFLATQNQVNLLQMSSGRTTEFLKSRTFTILFASYSPDGQWVTIAAFIPNGPRRIFIARLLNGSVAPESEWIVVHDNPVVAEFPQWSPDGNVIYFFSYLDGSDCVCARRLESASKRPVGSTFAVYRFSGVRRLGPAWASILSMQQLAVAGDKIVFSFTEQSGNVWMRAQPID